MTSPSRRTPPPSDRARGSRLHHTAPRQTFLERHRSKLLWGLAGAAFVAVVTMAFLNATSPTYACSTEWEPATTQAPGPDATPRLGYVQDDFGQGHVTIGSFVKYVLCPPASGKHYNGQGEGPVRAGVYGPDDQATPMGWIHNLEHGGVVLLYRCADGDTGCTDAGQQATRDFFGTFPNSPICNLPAASTLVVARFDDMAWPYAALVWGQVLPLDSFDAQRIKDFFAQQGERTNPEPFCPKPTPTPAPTGTPAPSGTPEPSGTPAPTGTPAPVPSASPSPGAS